MSELDYESVEPVPEDKAGPATPTSAAKAAMLQAVARWIEELTAANDLAHPDLASREQAAHEVRVSQQIRAMFRSLSSDKRQDPAAIAQARARAATLIGAELGIGPIQMAVTPEEQALSAVSADRDDDDHA